MAVVRPTATRRRRSCWPTSTRRRGSSIHRARPTRCDAVPPTTGVAAARMRRWAMSGRHRRRRARGHRGDSAASRRAARAHRPRQHPDRRRSRTRPATPSSTRRSLPRSRCSSASRRFLDIVSDQRVSETLRLMGPATGCAPHARRRARGVPAPGPQGDARRLDRAARHELRADAERDRLPDRRAARARAARGDEQERVLERARRDVVGGCARRSASRCRRSSGSTCRSSRRPRRR